MKLMKCERFCFVFIERKSYWPSFLLLHTLHCTNTIQSQQLRMELLYSFSFVLTHSYIMRIINSKLMVKWQKVTKNFTFTLNLFLPCCCLIPLMPHLTSFRAMLTIPLLCGHLLHKNHVEHHPPYTFWSSLWQIEFSTNFDNLDLQNAFVF